ncbi:MAG: proline--tRNA ligase [Proteobacteria bacterium]|nr:MAG: proline--tRNA ligase [Pseudomonadota bacterium]
MPFPASAPTLHDPWEEVQIDLPKRGAAITPTRDKNYPEWYLQVISAADLADQSPVRGCMVVRPWGYGIWEEIQNNYNPILRRHGVQNASFPMFIPLSFFEKEAAHAEGFAKEVAVVTHRRLVQNGEGKLVPSSPLEEPLVVRPTSEMIIGDSFSRWVQSHRDLPLLVNQWCSVVRMEMRTRPFLRTAEFLWHEGHSVHASSEDAMRHTMAMLQGYKSFMQEVLAIPVIDGEKLASERFAGAEQTFTVEAMMQDGKALQAGTSHYLGQNFAKASVIQFQNKTGQLEHAYTTSWGMSSRLIGALVMTHGDDDGLRVPPRVAPAHVVILPIQGGENHGQVHEYAERVRTELERLQYHGQPLRVHLDNRDLRGGDKNWQWIKKGAPLRLEIGKREQAVGSMTLLRRDKGHTDRVTIPLCDAPTLIPFILDTIQAGYFKEASERMQRNTREDVTTLKELLELFTPHPTTGKRAHEGFVKAFFDGETNDLRPLDPLGLSVRCVPLSDQAAEGRCIITGKSTKQRVIIARAY